MTTYNENHISVRAEFIKPMGEVLELFIGNVEIWPDSTAEISLS